MEKSALNKSHINSVIGLYNSVAHKNLQYGSQKNIDAVTSALTCNSAVTLTDVRQFVKDKIRDDRNAGKEPRHITEICTAFVAEQNLLALQKKIEAQEPAKTPEVKSPSYSDSVTKGASQAIDLLSGVLTSMLGSVKMDEVRAEVTAQAREEITKFIADNYGTLERKTRIMIGDQKKEVKGVTHKKFERVLTYVANNVPVFLTGPAGSGKNFLCAQIAEALGLDFYFSNAVTQEYKITGFTDANGHYQESQFYKAFKNGGLFMLDEMDASIPEVLVVLNAAIENRYFDFPAPVGMVKAHPNFRIVAAGNTFGLGANYEYVGRNQLDGASLDRFATIRIDYDPRIEESVTLGNKDLLDFCRAFRDSAVQQGIKVIVSYRAMGRMAKLASYIDAVDLVAENLVKGMDKQDINIIKNGLHINNQYSRALGSLC